MELILVKIAGSVLFVPAEVLELPVLETLSVTMITARLVLLVLQTQSATTLE